MLVPISVADPPADEPVEQLLELDVDGQVLLVHDAAAAVEASA